MKHLLIASLPLLLLASCDSGQSDAEKLATQIESAAKQTRPGTVATQQNGWTLKAKINGKEWTADAMMPPDVAGRIIGYLDKEYIGLPYNRQYLVVGKRIALGENDAADLSTNDKISMWASRKGEMQITTINGDWAEGTFYFTGGSSRSAEIKEVTDGFFRISLARAR